MLKLYEIDLNMTGDVNVRDIILRQDDSLGNTLRITLKDGANDFDILDTDVITLFCKKSDDTVVTIAVTGEDYIDEERSEVVFNLESQCLTDTGNVTCCVQIQRDTAVATTSDNFYLFVVESIDGGEAAESTDYTDLQSLITSLQSLSDIGTISDAMITAEALRVIAESGRVTSEDARVIAEAARVVAESKRTELEHKGAYVAETTYKKYNVVSYEGGSFMCLQESVGHTPEAGTYWQVIATKGDQGEAGEAGDTGPMGPSGTEWQGLYSASKTYSIGDVVYYGGSSYICILGATGKAPTNVTYWDTFVLKGTDGEDGRDGLGTGDMEKVTFDPNGVNDDVFDMDNMVEGTAKILTADERTAIATIGDKQDAITSGTADPSGGSDGDIYLQYE